MLRFRPPWLSFSVAAAPGRKSGGFWSKPLDEPRQRPIVAGPLLQPMCAVNGYGFLPRICLSGRLLVSWRPDSLGRTASPRWLIRWRSGSSSLLLLVGFTLCFMSLGLNLCFLLPLTLPAIAPPPHPLVLWMAPLPIGLGDYSTSGATAEGFSISWTGRVMVQRRDAGCRPGTFWTVRWLRTTVGDEVGLLLGRLVALLGRGVLSGLGVDHLFFAVSVFGCYIVCVACFDSSPRAHCQRVYSPPSLFLCSLALIVSHQVLVISLAFPL